MDIARIDASKKATSGITIRIRDPRVKRDFDRDDDNRPYLLSNDDDPKSFVTIDIYGPDHPKVSRLLAPQRARYTQQALMIQSRKGVKLSAEDITAEEQENLEIAVAATRGWTGWTDNGEPWPYNEANARALYLMSRDVQDQILAALRDRSVFLTA